LEKLTYKLFGVNWRLVATLMTLVVFTVGGAADDGAGF
jgi:hypothetical protein